MKTIKDAVIDHNGKWLGESEGSKLYRWNDLWIFSSKVYPGYKLICDQQEFEEEAKELGFINGYRWGVEYPTNGNRPDLADDIRVCCFSMGDVWYEEDLMTEWNWSWIAKFKITDPRYKPADTSYLNAPSQEQSLTHSEEGLTHSEWYDYENQKALRLPPVGVQFDGYWPKDDKPKWSKGIVAYSSKEHLILKFDDGEENYYHSTDIEKQKPQFRPLDHATRKAELEKSKFIEAAEAAFKATGFDKLTDFGFLFDAGFRLPEQSK